MGITVTEEVPRRTCPLRHSVGFPSCCRTALRALAVDERFDLCQRAFAVLAGFEILYRRQTQRQLVIGYRHHAALRAVHDGDRFAPVTLTVERPVLHLVLYALFAAALFCQHFQHLRNGIFLVGDAVEDTGVHHFTVTGIGFLRDVAALDDFDNIDAELLGEIIVTGIVCRHCHNGTGTITHHNIVGNVDRNLLAGNRIDAGQSIDLDTSLILYQLRPFKLALFRTFRFVCVQFCNIGNAVAVLLNDRVLRSNHHKGDTVQGIRTGGIDPQLFVCMFLDSKVDKCTGRLADPVLLLEFDIRQIVHFFQTLQQLVCILGDPQIPDFLGLLDDLAVTNVALAAL